MNIIPTNYRAEGTPARPNIHLQLLPNPIHTRYEINYPEVMNRTLQVTKTPLISIGAASDKYTGMTIAAIPTPNYLEK
jgi:hypothetical protein